jgi:hypothetical protein
MTLSARLDSRFSPSRWLLALLISTAAAAGTGTVVAVAGNAMTTDTNLLLICAIALVALAPILFRALNGSFDPFEPVVCVSVGLVVFFVAHPLYEIYVNHYQYLGRDIQGTYSQALLASLVAAVAVQVGYHAPFQRRLARCLPKPPEALYEDTFLVVAIVLTGLAALFLFWSAEQRGGMTTLLVNRSVQLSSVTPFVAAGFMLALPAILLFLVLSPKRRVLPVALAAVPVGIILLMALPGGNRRYLLPLIFSVCVLYFLRRGKRPSMVLAAIACALLVLVVVTPARASRSGETSYGSSLLTSVRNPLDSFSSLLESQDTSMVDNVAMELEVLGNQVPYRHGREFLTDTVLLPIPGELWSGKPEKTRTLLIEHYYGMRNGVCVSQCPTFGLVGDLYSDFGLMSVAFGSALLGLLFGLGYQYFRQHGGSGIVQAGYSAALWIAFYSWWGGFYDFTLLAVLFVIPIAAAAVIAGRRLTATPATLEQRPEIVRYGLHDR